MIQGKKVVITGGLGFIGSHIAETICKENTVIIVDNESTGSRDNVKDFRDYLTIIKEDICNTQELIKIFQDVDYVLHQAALCSVPRSVKDPISTHKNNADGTLSVLVAARDAGVKRVVYASSSSVYGDSETLPKVETLRTAPISPYGVSKLIGEHYCKVFNDLYGLETVALRYFNVFGPRQTPDSPYAAVIPLFIKAIRSGKNPIIFGDGLQTRDFSFVENNVSANILACTAKDASGRVFNIACGKKCSLLDIIDYINKALKTNSTPIFQKEREGDIKHSLADISLAKEILGYKPLVDVPLGIDKTVSWFLSEYR